MKWTCRAHLILAVFLITGSTERSAWASGMVMYVAGSGNECGTVDLSNPASITYRSIGTTNTQFLGMGFTSKVVFSGTPVEGAPPCFKQP